MKKIIQSLVFSAFALLIIASCSKDEAPVVAPAKFTIDLTTKDFGNVDVETNISQTFKISNKGGQNLELKSFTLTGTNKAEFSTNAVKTTVKAGKDYSFKVNFVPATKGSKTATVSIATNVGTKTITLKGNGTPKPKAVFSINPTSKDFGSVEVNKMVKQTFTIKNTGNADLTISELSITGNNPSEFPFNGKPTTPITVAPNKTVSISIAFKPMSVGNKSASLNIKSSVGNQTVALNGKATAQPMAVFNINPTSKNFGDIEVSKTKTQTFTIKNTGNANLVISGISLEGTNTNQFSTNGTAKTIAPNQTYSFTATFKPTAVGSKTANIKIATNVGAKKVTLNGNATQPATACATPVNIPNASFKNALLDHGVGITGRGISKIDTNGDGIICTDEATAYTGTIKVYRKNITNLTGIEAFVNITGLNCSSNLLTSLDITKNLNLELLICRANKLTSLDITKNTSLKYLYCDYNKLTNLDVTKNINLEELNCGLNQLTSLDVTKNINLLQLYCNNNQLTNLDVTKNTSLKYFNCAANQLISLDVTKNTTLLYLYCLSNRLTSLDVTKNTSLNSLYCKTNRLTNLDVTKNTSLENLNCTNNRLTSLDVTKNTSLVRFYCTNNHLTSLNVANGNNSGLRLMHANNNSNLTCIQHDSGFNPTTNTQWKKENTANWSTNCP